MVASSLPVSVAEKQEILESFESRQRLERVMLILTKLLQKLELGTKIQSEVQEEISKSQREYYLREQMKAIRKELGEEEEATWSSNDLKKRIDEAKLSEEARVGRRKGDEKALPDEPGLA